MEKLRYVMCFLVITGFMISTAPAQTLTVGTAPWIPWQMKEGEKITGITIDILREISTQTGITFEFEVMPHKRMMRMFQLNQIDVESIVDPAWREDQRDISVYSVPVVITRDVILARKDQGIEGESLEDFFGLRIGCGLGYYYPEGFQEAFEENKILREDIPEINMENNILKMNANRIDAAIFNQQQALYFLKKLNQDPDEFEVVYEFAPSPLSMRLHVSHRELLPMINKTIENMKVNGRIDAIVKKYILNP